MLSGSVPARGRRAGAPPADGGRPETNRQHERSTDVQAQSARPARLPAHHRHDRGRGRGRRRGSPRGADRWRRRPARGRPLRLRHRLQPHRDRLVEVGRPDRPLRRRQDRGRHGHRRPGLPHRPAHHRSPPQAGRARELRLPVDSRLLQGVDRRLEPPALRAGDRPRHHSARPRRPRGRHQHPARLLSAGEQGAHADPGLQRVLHRHPGRRLRGRGEPPQARQRPLPDGLRGPRAAHRPRHARVHPVQPAQPHRQRVVALGPRDPRRDMQPPARRRARRRDPLRLRHQGPHLHAVRDPRRRGHRPQQRHLQVGSASRSTCR